MTLIDYYIIGFYLLFMLAVGLVLRRLAKNTSDYFRAGGAMPWWITGTSAWIASFTAWTFVGAAGKVYETGTLVLWTFYSSALALLVVFFYTGRRFRRLRVVTWMEAVRARFGPAAEQFYTWVKLPLMLLGSGVALNAIGVFMTAVFGIDGHNIPYLLAGLGAVITLVAFAGGAFAVLASDFVQMFLIVTITLVVAFLTLQQPAIGGLSGLVTKLPAHHFHWSQIEHPILVTFWIATQLWFKFSDSLSIENSTMYLMAKSDRDAKRMVLIPIIGSFLGPLIWFIPSMAATITHPDLASEFKGLSQPHEAAYVRQAMDVLPQGMLGLLLCAMLGATLTSMDAGLNKGVGIFVRSVYQPLINPHATEKRQLFIGKVCTLLFGTFIVAIAIEVSKLRTIGLFDLTNLIAAKLLLPMALPLIYGLFYKRTPGWSAWSTALVGFAGAWLVPLAFPAETFARFMHWTTLKPQEVTDYNLAATTLGYALLGTLWFFFTTVFYRETYSTPVSAAEQSVVVSEPAYSSVYTEHERIEALFANLARPVDAKTEGLHEQDELLFRLMGSLCLIYGTFILCLMLIPQEQPLKRLCFLFCGGIITVSGTLLYWRSKVLQRKRGTHSSLASAHLQPLAVRA